MALDEQVFTVLGEPEIASGPFIFSCEHASSSTGSHPPDSIEHEILQSHWGWDIGAAALVEAWVKQTDGLAVLCNLSRLLLDVNRSPESDTLIKTHVEGHELSFNKGLTASIQQKRIRKIHQGFHQGCEQAFAARIQRSVAHLLSIHSFTPSYGQQDRWMEIGIVFDRYEDEAKRLAKALKTEGFAVALNEPYSGLGGELMYSATRHGTTLGVPYLELEIRQDLIGDDAGVNQVAQRIRRALKVFEPVQT